MGKMKKRSLRNRNHHERNAAVLLTLLVTGVVAVSYASMRGSPGTSGLLGPGERAPKFALESVNGTSFDLGSYANKSDVLLFFNEGLSCSPCLQQMVDINKDYAAFRQMGLTVVSITSDPLSGLETWARNTGTNTMMVLSDSTLQVGSAYDVLGSDVGSMHPGMAPGHTFILVGKDGKVLWREDYGTSTMYVPMSQLIASVQAAVG